LASGELIESQGEDDLGRDIAEAALIFEATIRRLWFFVHNFEWIVIGMIHSRNVPKDRVRYFEWRDRPRSVIP
jgi:hypothetical protein